MLVLDSTTKRVNAGFETPHALSSLFGRRHNELVMELTYHVIHINTMERREIVEHISIDRVAWVFGKGSTCKVVGIALDSYVL